MKYEEIHEMLDRYWDGDTTLEEERRIKTYFNSGTIDERLRQFAPLFVALREEQTVQLANKAKVAPMRPQMYQWAVAASVALLLAAGWWMFGREETSTPMAMQTPDQPSKAMPIQAPVTPQASLVVEERKALATPLYKRKNPTRKPKPNTAIDPETAQAMAEIKAALALVSAKLDKGRIQAVKGASFLEAMEKVPKRKEG